MSHELLPPSPIEGLFRDIPEDAPILNPIERMEYLRGSLDVLRSTVFGKVASAIPTIPLGLWALSLSSQSPEMRPLPFIAGLSLTVFGAYVGGWAVSDIIRCSTINAELTGLTSVLANRYLIQDTEDKAKLEEL